MGRVHLPAGETDFGGGGLPGHRSRPERSPPPLRPGLFARPSTVILLPVPLTFIRPWSPPTLLARRLVRLGCMSPSGTASGFRSSRMLSTSVSSASAAPSTRSAFPAWSRASQACWPARR